MTSHKVFFTSLFQLYNCKNWKLRNHSFSFFLSVNSDKKKRKCWLFLTNLWRRVPRLFRVLNRNRSRLWKMGFWPTTLALSTLALSLLTSHLRASLLTRSKIRTHSYPGILQSIYPISLTHQQTKKKLKNMVYIHSVFFSWIYDFWVDLILVILGSVWFLAMVGKKKGKLGSWIFCWVCFTLFGFIIKKMRLLSVVTKWQLPFLTVVWWSLDNYLWHPFYDDRLLFIIRPRYQSILV